ncbi:hypothetical protein LuPra_04196 [Luteitalea pratensis]|uniref:Uncharacterized protein n=1 Tax=Luteitalea pratensis TaxID=1855912 RepID=A0A143PS03_LUTPR|nr:ACT domain-containing protein [Luteitalea pratensis]AMY10953.1 hypothetical protein LuPra_04196 [Luteitalea pratensis]
MSLTRDAFPIRLRKLEVTLAVCRCDPSAAVEPWMQQGPVWSITRTPDELSIVCPIDRVPAGVRHEGPFTAFVVAGPLDFSLTGIVSRLSSPLAGVDIPVFVTATFDTDFVLVPAARELDVRQAWLAAGLAIDT